MTYRFHHSSRILTIGLLAIALPGLGKASEERTEAIAFFESRIRPVLASNCANCHGDRSRPAKAEPRLDTRAAMLSPAGGKPAPIIANDPEMSPLIVLLRSALDDEKAMPEHRVSPDQLSDFENWVRLGAVEPDDAAPAAAPQTDLAAARKFWSLLPLADPAPPDVLMAGWMQNPIDRFILARLQQKSLKPVDRADKGILLRRATFDLTGLPPTPEELSAFLTDNAPDAYSRVLDRLLASPRYGEKWGRHWLDLAHYSDTAGDDADFPIPQAALYRDWVIDSFNRDEPYDQFVQDQIAGDLLPAHDQVDHRNKIIATGYLALSRRFGVAPETEMPLTIADTIDTLGRSILGATLGCARCHDHKFDPFSRRDYYALYGIFESSQYAFPGSEERPFQKDLVPLCDKAKADELLAPYNKQVAAAETDVRRWFHERMMARDGATYGRLTEEWSKAKQHRNELARQAPPMECAYGVCDGVPHDARIQIRGEAGDVGEVALRGFPQVLGGQTLPASEKGSGRLELAAWLTDRTNPLFARVMVNRIWQYHFGKGIVQTPSDFGTRGKAPTHPELLDFLARRFIDGGYSIKAMHRLIMLSRTYQLASAENPGDEKIDPMDDDLWRFRRRRLEAEEVRDSVLAASGNLDLSPPGNHPFPPSRDWQFTQHAAFAAIYPTTHRSVFVMQQRIKRHPFFVLFDGADPNLSVAERSISITPLQALYMMNDSFVHEESRQFAQRVLTAGDTDDGRLQYAYLLALGRQPLSSEYAEARDYLRVYFDQLQSASTSESEREVGAWASYLRCLFSSNEFMFVE